MDRHLIYFTVFRVKLISIVEHQLSPGTSATIGLKDVKLSHGSHNLVL